MLPWHLLFLSKKNKARICTGSYVAFDDIFLVVDFVSDVENIKNFLESVLSKNGSVLKDPKPIVRLEEFGVNGLIFLVRGFVLSDNMDFVDDVAGQIRAEIIKEFKANNIDIISRTNRINVYVFEFVESKKFIKVEVKESF